MTGDKIYRKGVVSFCCLSYKHGEFLKYCLDSILNQDYKNIEVIAMDDGSPDNSGEILCDYASKSPFPIEVILQNNTGNIAKNFNTLLSKASGEFVSFIAMDDFLEKDAIISKINFFEQDNNMVFVANKLNNKVDEKNKLVNNAESPINWSKEVCENAKDLLEIEFNNLSAFYIQGGVFKKKIVDEVGGFDDDQLGDDIILRTKILLLMVKNQDLKFILLNSVAVNYRMHDTNIHKNAFRQVGIVKGWKDSYFPKRKFPKIFYKWISGAINQVLIERDLLRYAHLIQILNQALSMEDLDTREKSIKWLIPTPKIQKMFSIRINSKKIRIILFGYNLVDKSLR